MSAHEQPANHLSFSLCIARASCCYRRCQFVLQNRANNDHALAVSVHRRSDAIATNANYAPLRPTNIVCPAEREQWTYLSSWRLFGAGSALAPSNGIICALNFTANNPISPVTLRATIPFQASLTINESIIN